MRKLLLLLLVMFLINYVTNAQCPTAAGDATIGCGSPAPLTAPTNAVIYSVVATACTPVVITGTNAFPTACDDCVTGQIPIGFNFNFYGNVYSTAVIQSNGIVGFGPGFSFTGYSAFAIPSGGVPNNYIAGIFADIDIRYGGTISYQTIGTAPNRRFVVHYNNVVPYNMGSSAGTGTANFQIVLNENGSFQVIIQQFSNNWNASTSGALATSGAENDDGTRAFPITGRNSTDWPGINAAAQDCNTFNPQPCIFTRWRVGGTQVSTSASYTPSPIVNTTYVAEWNCGGTPCNDNVVVSIVTPTLTLGVPLSNTSCVAANGSIPLNFTDVPNGSYTLNYQRNGVGQSTTITVSGGVANLTGLNINPYSNFSLTPVAGCPSATNAGPVSVADGRTTLTTTGVTIPTNGTGSISSASCGATGTVVAQNTAFAAGALATTDPTYTRSYGGTTYGASTVVYYDVTSFTVSTNGAYTFDLCAPTFDSHASLYQISFNPASPATNFLNANDDGSSACTSDALITQTLTAGVTYFLVTGSFSNGVTGSYDWRFTGPAGSTITVGGTSNSIQWYTAPTGGSSIGSTTPFNPVGVAGSGLANTSTVGTYTYYAACSSSPTCRTQTNFIISSPLSIDLLVFDALNEGNSNRIFWQTASETNNTGFVVQKSSDASKFNDLTSVDAKSKLGSKYEVIDTQPFEKVTYYRLSDIDVNGKTNYSNVIAINSTVFDFENNLSIIPNPATEKITINITCKAATKGELQIYNIAGKLIMQNLIELNDGNNSIEQNVNGFDNGIYFVKIVTSDLSVSPTVKFIKQ